MKYAIVTIGSQGDVEPFLALGKGLQARGHHVRIAALRRFESLIQGEGIEYAPLAGDAVEVIRLLIGENVTPLQYFPNLDTLLNPIKSKFLRDVYAACEGADAILYSTLGSIAYHVADKLDIPCFRAFFCPLDPTCEFPDMTAPDFPLGRLYNRLTFWVGDRAWSHATRKHLNPWRTEMGLAKIPLLRFPYRRLHGRPVPTLYAYSTLISPKPHDWDENRYLTGYWVWTPNTEWQPDSSLTDFLNSGTKPVYIGFGSMVGGSFEQALTVTLEALKRTGLRAILSAGWGSLGGIQLPDTVYQAGYIPHGWLFQHVSAAVHHGGAGTTASSLRAGLPTIVVPFGGDQPFWGERVYRLGVGPKSIPRKKLNINNFSVALTQAVSDDTMIRNAAELGEKLRAEDGVANAIQIIEKLT